jgi:hypothetical protein
MANIQGKYVGCGKLLEDSKYCAFIQNFSSLGAECAEMMK